jgi:hypothetical protein
MRRTRVRLDRTSCPSFKSNYIPRALAVFGVTSSAWCVACTLIFYVFPDFSKAVNLWWFDSPMAIFELALSGWLLFKGIRTPLVVTVSA